MDIRLENENFRRETAFGDLEFQLCVRLCDVRLNNAPCPSFDTRLAYT